MRLAARMLVVILAFHVIGCGWFWVSRTSYTFSHDHDSWAYGNGLLKDSASLAQQYFRRYGAAGRCGWENGV